MRIYQYGRLEERYSLDPNNAFEENFVLKLRYKIGTTIPIKNAVIAVGTFYIPVSIEMFFDLTAGNEEQNNDRFRVELGLGYRWKNDIYFKVLYTGQEIYDNQGAGVNLDAGISKSDHILRLSVIQKFGRKEDQSK